MTTTPEPVTHFLLKPSTETVVEPEYLYKYKFWFDTIPEDILSHLCFDASELLLVGADPNLECGIQMKLMVASCPVKLLRDKCDANKFTFCNERFPARVLATKFQQFQCKLLTKKPVNGIQLRFFRPETGLPEYYDSRATYEIPITRNELNGDKTRNELNYAGHTLFMKYPRWIKMD